jgi:hypothetical protein
LRTERSPGATARGTARAEAARLAVNRRVAKICIFLDITLGRIWTGRTQISGVSNGEGAPWNTNTIPKGAEVRGEISRTTEESMSEKPRCSYSIAIKGAVDAIYFLRS